MIAPSAAHNFSVKTIEFKMAAISVKRSIRLQAQARLIYCDQELRFLGLVKSMHYTYMQGLYDAYPTDQVHQLKDAVGVEGWCSNKQFIQNTS